MVENISELCALTVIWLMDSPKVKGSAESVRFEIGHLWREAHVQLLYRWEIYVNKLPVTLAANAVCVYP